MSEKENVVKTEIENVNRVYKGDEIKFTFSRSVWARLIQSSDITKNNYKQIREYITSFENIKIRESWNYITIVSGKKTLMKMNLTKNDVLLYLALTPAQINKMNYEYEDVASVKAFESTPVKFRINDEPDSALKATKLVNVVMSRFKIAKTDNVIEFEIPPYESHNKLISDGKIKVYARNLTTNALYSDEESLNIYEETKEEEVQEEPIETVEEENKEENKEEKEEVKEEINETTETEEEVKEENNEEAVETVEEENNEEVKETEEEIKEDVQPKYVQQIVDESVAKALESIVEELKNIREELRIANEKKVNEVKEEIKEENVEEEIKEEPINVVTPEVVETVENNEEVQEENKVEENNEEVQEENVEEEIKEEVKEEIKEEPKQKKGIAKAITNMNNVQLPKWSFYVTLLSIAAIVITACIIVSKSVM